MPNVQEFAERVVFGTTLEEKLSGPGQLTHSPDASRVAPVGTIRVPGRPAGLPMQNGPGAAQPPGNSNLENERARGQLLHFLANHELLATELMALVLLKFPDAPHAFRQGVLVTLQEEQEHTRLYLKRMEECGVEFGSFPLSGYFWRIVEPMQSPMDFVARLSLTFEQANLDYSLHFAKVFDRVGDKDTSKILQQIYLDEIGHVQHGLNWFRKWKDPELSDWEAYQGSLTFPMSPERARGPSGSFNREGRRRAGLSSDFVDEVELFRQSRGRTPTVRWFDPAVEAKLAGPLNTREQILMHQLACDLECLQICLSKRDDVVLVRRMPSEKLRKQLLNAGFDLPEFVLMDERESLRERKLRDLSPWTWTPSDRAVAEPFLCAAREQPPTLTSRHTQLFRKSWATERLNAWLDSTGLPDGTANGDCVGVVVNSDSDIADALERFAGRGYSAAIFKSDLSTSGRGQRRFACQEAMTDCDRRWLASLAPSGQGAGPLGIVEPELVRKLDLSFLWDMPSGLETPRFLGWTRPIVTPGRRYAGTRLGRPFHDCDKEMTQFLLADKHARLHAMREWLEVRLAHCFQEIGFRGPFGVDAFVFRAADGRLRIKPMVELNPRVTMGHVALSLEKRLAPGVKAEFRTMTRAEWDAAESHIRELGPCELNNGRLHRGVVPLSDVDERSKLVPVLVIDK